MFVALLIHERNVLNFLFAYKKNTLQNTFILAPKLDPLLRACDIHHNIVKVQTTEQETGN